VRARRAARRDETRRDEHPASSIQHPASSIQPRRLSAALRTGCLALCGCGIQIPGAQGQPVRLGPGRRTNSHSNPNPNPNSNSNLPERRRRERGYPSLHPSIHLSIHPLPLPDRRRRPTEQESAVTREAHWMPTARSTGARPMTLLLLMPPSIFSLDVGKSVDPFSTQLSSSTSASSMTYIAPNTQPLEHSNTRIAEPVHVHRQSPTAVFMSCRGDARYYCPQGPSRSTAGRICTVVISSEAAARLHGASPLLG
jgi:hypothetical protein